MALLEEVLTFSISQESHPGSPAQFISGRPHQEELEEVNKSEIDQAEVKSTVEKKKARVSNQTRKYLYFVFIREKVNGRADSRLNRQYNKRKVR